MNSEIFHLPLTSLTPGNHADDSDPAPQLPKSYNKNHLEALPRDPNCIWLYWELKNTHGSAEIRLYFADSQRLALKVSCRFENVSYYLHVPDSGRTYYAELGTLDDNHRWHPALRSNKVTLPYGYPADQIASQQTRLNGLSSAVSSAISSRVSSRISSGTWSRRSS